MPPRPRYEFRWRHKVLRKLLQELGIHTHHQFAVAMDWPKSSVYDTFGPDWSGVANTGPLAELSVRWELNPCDLAVAVEVGKRPSPDGDCCPHRHPTRKTKETNHG